MFKLTFSVIFNNRQNLFHLAKGFLDPGKASNPFLSFVQFIYVYVLQTHADSYLSTAVRFVQFNLCKLQKKDVTDRIDGFQNLCLSRLAETSSD